MSISKLTTKRVREPHLDAESTGDAESGISSPPDLSSKPEAISQREKQSMALLPCVGISFDFLIRLCQKLQLVC